MRFLLALLLTLTCTAAIAADWGSYDNSRFGYAIAVPPGFAGEGVAANGDGQVFRSADGTQEFRAWGGNIIEASFELAMEAAMSHAGGDGWRLSQQRVTPSWASYTGSRNGIVLEARTIALCGGRQFAAFSIEYPERDLAEMERVIARLAGSLRGTGTGC